jgi:hypothetical protein
MAGLNVLGLCCIAESWKPHRNKPVGYCAEVSDLYSMIGLGMTLNSAMHLCPGSNPGLPRATSRNSLVICTSSWAGCVLGFWRFPLYELHVYSSTGSMAEAQSEYGVFTEYLIVFSNVFFYDHPQW